MSILAGVEAILSPSLRGAVVAPARQVREPVAAGARPEPRDLPLLLERAYARLTQNLELLLYTRPWGVSRASWSFAKDLGASTRQATPESALARAIASAAGADWANEVSAAAGPCGTSDDDLSVDLVHRRGPRSYELIELRVQDGTPLDGASRILQLALLYLLARQHYPPWERESRELILAEEIHLRVLAPAGFYAEGDLAWLENALDAALPGFSAAILDKPVLASFAFEVFPAEFRWPDPGGSVTQQLMARRLRWGG
jgi:hypothetical protein